MELPLAVIGIPVFNGEKYIAEAIESLKKQSYQNWVCIINNNCSTDETVEIVNRCTQGDSRFQINNNTVFLNAVENWNKTFSLIPSDAVYFKILPCDDWLFPSFLSEMISVMEQDENIGVCSSFRLDGVKVHGYGLNVAEGNVFAGHTILENEFTKKIYVTGSLNTVLYRVSKLKLLDSYPSIYNVKNIHSDSELCYDLLYKSDFGFVFQILSYTRRHDKTLSSEAKMNNSYFLGAEYALAKYAIKLGLTKIYEKHRRLYAWFLFVRLVLFDFRTYKWHQSRLENRIGLREFMAAIFQLNPISVILKKIRNTLLR